ncbi:hypothetical protein ROS217_17547 [Roseovarius sp. 217]|nr:hypothetical protein ROS217_17547 [Roseovarius sp. 217]
MQNSLVAWVTAFVRATPRRPKPCAIRGDAVTVSRDFLLKAGARVEISGRLNHVLDPKDLWQCVNAIWGVMVAEEGLEPPTRGL